MTAVQELVAEAIQNHGVGGGLLMALYHFHVTQIKRSEGRTAVASAAYRAGEKLHNFWDGETTITPKKAELS